MGNGESYKARNIHICTFGVVTVIKQGRQCTYKVTVGRVRATIVAMGKQ